MKKTQQKQIENHLLKYGKITTMDAIINYSITRLSEYIRILRHNKCWDIDGVWRYKKDSKGKIIKKWVEYQLIKE